MTFPTVTETRLALEPVSRDPFIDDVSTPAGPPPPTPATTRRRIID